MNEAPQFSISSLGRSRNPGPAEVEALLELLPLAALLVDGQTLQIRSANSRAVELTMFPRPELSGLDVSVLLTELNDGAFDKRTLGEQKVVKLNRRNESKIKVLVTPTYLPPKSKWAILTLVDEDQRQRQAAENLRPGHLWSNLHSLVSAPHQPHFATALNLALQAGQALTEADTVSIYRASNQQPGLQRFANLGDAQSLPEYLTAQDLIYLQKPHLWTPGRRQSASLHRAAHESELAFVASVPLGQPKAVIGLVVVADSKSPPQENMLHLVQILAATCTAIFQQHVLVSQLRDSLEEHDRALSFSQIVEDTVQEGLVLVAPDLQTIRINPAAEMILGYSSREVAGQPVQNILIGTETLLPALITAQQGNATYSLDNVRLYRRHGEIFLAYVRLLPVIYEGSLEGIIVLVKDLSEQEQIREHAQQLEQQAFLGEVTAIFAHEVRNPINNLSTGLQLMALNLPQEDPNQELITRLQQDCDRLAELMKSVLSFSRPTDYEMEAVDLGLLIQRLLERQLLRMERVNVKYHVQVDQGCPQVEGNPRALEQVFTNLISNAIQAMSENGGHLALKIQNLKTAEGRVYVEVSIADTGPGIPKELQERIFQPFFTTNRNGTGLGLAIAKRIITAHKGNIRVTSFPGGTVFHVQIPPWLHK